jgi:hypothetical protein
VTGASADAPAPETGGDATADAGAGSQPGEGTAAGAAARAQRADRLIEIAALILLGAGTLLAAWSGYQAALWNGIQADDYVRGSGERVESTRATTQAGQDRLYDSQVFSQWLNAYDAGNTHLATIYERRFRAEFRVAWTAWMATDPLDNPDAPPGPMFMPEYVQAPAQSAAIHEAQAAALVQAGEAANDVSDHYVLFTVVFATVLFLAAIADRFKWRKARVGVLAIGATLAVFGAIGLLQLPLA